MTTTPTVGSAVTFSFDPLASLPEVTALADDTFVFAWQDGTDIHARHLDEQGSFTGGDFLQTVTSDDAKALSGPQLYQQADGSLMLTYDRHFSDTDEDIFSHKIDGSPSDSGNVTPVESSSKDEFLVDSAAMTNGGVVAYEVPGAGSSTTVGSHLELRFIDTAGNPIGNRVFIRSVDGESQQNASLITLNNDNIVLAYEDFSAKTGARDVRFHLITPSGFDSEAVPISDAGANAGFPDLAKLSDGSFVILWQQTGGIAMRHILESGQIATGVVPLPGSVGAFVPKIAALHDGTFMVAWTAASGAESDGSPNLDIFAQRMGITASGEIQSIGDQVHFTEAGDQGLFQLSMTTLADGRVVIAYGSETGDATNITQLEYRILDPRDNTLTGDEHDNTIVGRVDQTSISGLGGNDKLIAFGGNDTLLGGDGNDTMDGGLGNDKFDGGAGIDTVTFKSIVGGAVNVDLSTGVATGQGSDSLTGIENVIGSFFADNITGDAGNNIIDGGFDKDVMRGLGGDDNYIVDNAKDAVVEGANGGMDVVTTSVNYALTAGQHIEILNADEFSIDPLHLIGNEFAQRINGNSSNNILDGKGGADTMSGRAGDDTYIVDNAGDVVLEWQEWGVLDQVKTSVNYTLGADVWIEKLSTTDAAGTSALKLTGNEIAQTIIGNAGANVINGKAGADTMSGLGGNDTYFVDNAKDAIIEGKGGGIDQVATGVDYTLGSGVQVEKLTATNPTGTHFIFLTGNEFSQTIVGNDGRNALDGKGGADTMIGGGGDDFYAVDNAGDRVVEQAHGGSDIVYASTNYALQAGQSIEALVAAPSIEAIAKGAIASINLTGNEFAQGLYGDDGNNILDGKGGADTLVGERGNDTYIVDNAGDEVSEFANQGVDRVMTSVSYGLGAGQSIEALSTTNNAGTSAINLTGNAFAQTITGNAGDNIINGSAGNDVLTGLRGDDSFVFNSVLNAATNVDRITDFSVSDDTIRLENAIFKGLKAGALSADEFFAGNAAHDANDHIIYNDATGALIYDSNGNAAGGATQFAVLSPHLALTAGDFVII